MNFSFLRLLMLLAGLTALISQPVLAQQEIDPDHYDQPIVAKAKAPVHHRAQQRTNIAARHSTRHRTHTAA